MEGVQNYRKRRKRLKFTERDGVHLMADFKTSGLGIDEMSPTYHTESLLRGEKQITVDCNRALIHYFAQLGLLKDVDSLDLDFVDSLLTSGADVKCTDKNGQTVLHEVARVWHVDVARFMVEKGADVNQADMYGRTPLHIAAAVDYPEMIDFLIGQGAAREARTAVENQTPVHFAAKNDACQSLKTLVKHHCEYKLVRDYKGRTPVHLAAESNRADSARLLLDLGAPASVKDNSGQTAIVWMITRMPAVAKIGLDQFYLKNGTRRRQYFYLNHLETQKPGEPLDGRPMSPLQAIVTAKQFDLVMHPVVQRLISIQWQQFGRTGAWLNMMLNLLFILVWSAIAVVNGTYVVEDQQREHVGYELPQDVWRVVLIGIGVILWLIQIQEGVQNTYTSIKKFQRYKKWRLGDLQKDIQYCHPRWPEEEEYLQAEKKDLDRRKPHYFDDWWNVFDWVIYTFLLVSLFSHVTALFIHDHVVSRTNIRISVINVILIWLRLLKSARAFSLLGPFIVMLGHMLGDVVRFLFLYLEFYIPFAIAYWLVFGGEKIQDDSEAFPNPYPHNTTVYIKGFEDPARMMFSLFRMTLVENYDYEGMKRADYIMADVLVGAWLAISAILCLNLFIALLSDTFQRVYDNAQANAMMLKAVTILNVWTRMSKQRKENFRSFIHTQCAPEEIPYDESATCDDDDLKKVAFQLKDELEDMKEFVRIELNKVAFSTASDSSKLEMKDKIEVLLADVKYSILNAFLEKKTDCLTEEKFETALAPIRDEIKTFTNNQETLMTEMAALKAMIQQLEVKQAPPPGLPPQGFYSLPHPRHRTSSYSRSRRRGSPSPARSERSRKSDRQSEKRREKKSSRRRSRDEDRGSSPSGDDVAQGLQSSSSTSTLTEPSPPTPRRRHSSSKSRSKSKTPSQKGSLPRKSKR
ncbi:transient receptor potential cation channel subfamily V member 1 isoform X2 [Lingula anatina]|uniref:Transient receptor potential cation channel subfamily V member 1 isoform X2 n=1 Tax=Lingula anatina TaxID=7574 RepID=A0A1S3I214_LINAN|nr:transient receptor potential cation channel subfamily V member 1 isoform X2 [Lingula anatina]|eukprot:XP_013391389.1 transient receptor potential cation channel subfamily V member 1 isoform X2 [Lingula anatina]